MADGLRRNTQLKILFIGNSFTARNDLPGLIAQMAQARGKLLEYHLISAGGSSLRRHWNGGQALKAINNGGYSLVVLQEQSTLPIKNPNRMYESVRLFDQAIKEARAKTVLYMTWARQNSLQSQKAITDAYESIGRELGATVVPVGVAWQSLLHKHDHPVLYDRDQSHPTLAGSYLAACVFLGTLFRESPVGLEGAGLDKKDRDLLQGAAWQACKAIAGTRSK